MTQTVGNVYAQALFELAQETAQEEQLYRELNETAALFAAHPDLKTLLAAPTLDVQERLSILRKVIGDGEGTMEHFLCLLVERRRIQWIADICAAFNQLYYAHFSIEEVWVTTAEPLTQSQKERLQEQLQKKLHKTILLKETIDAAILGGMIVQYGDTRMDNSLRCRMQELSSRLSQ